MGHQIKRGIKTYIKESVRNFIKAKPYSFDITVNDKTLRIELRDADTGNPLIGKITLTGIKDITLQYTGSDFLFTIEKIGRIMLKVDASGYFFVDREEPISSIGDHEIVIYLEKLEPGKQLDIEGIEFHPGTSEFMPSADVKLKRLKDFLALNSVIKVEIGGHVQAIGDNTFAAQKLSEARARRVVNYLVENGIEKERMTWKGYGNEKPIYPEPKLEWQEQANRRVEVTILFAWAAVAQVQSGWSDIFQGVACGLAACSRLKLRLSRRSCLPG